MSGEEEEDRKIVKFNVGGTRYEVAPSLIEMHPDTMLGKIVSKEWQNDPSAEIFIERNGSRFKYVLDYLRDGKVYVSIDMCKKAILDEMDYFGISYEEGAICHENVALHCALSDMGRQIDMLGNKIILASATSRLFRFVHLCLLHIPKIISTKRTKFSVHYDEHEFYKLCSEAAEIISRRDGENDERKPKLLEICKEYGFAAPEIEIQRGDSVRTFTKFIITLNLL